MSNKDVPTIPRYRVTVHLFYVSEMGITTQHHVKKFLLFNVEYSEIPHVIEKIYVEYTLLTSFLLGLI